MKILVIDDEITQRESLTGFLEHLGYKVVFAATGDEGIKLLDKNNINIVISDFRMKGLNGLQVVEEVKKRNPFIEVILITAYGDVDLAVQAMKAGARDFLTKPVDLDQLEIILKRAEEHFFVVEENKMFRKILKRGASFDEIISVSPQMEDVLNICARIANGTSSVLIRGETGVGKELVAKAIHYASRRKDKPFVAVNCSALNEHLLESELFGHEKGSFTGAHEARIGRFETANNGSLFLDEIGDIPLSVQIKLLRVLQEHTIERVGNSNPIKVNVRLITATHRNLEEEIKKEKFRHDLYYRLNVVPIHIPPLRERREDIPMLINSFLKRVVNENHSPVKGFTKEAEGLLISYDFPGNVRELENAIERAVLLTRSTYIKISDLPEIIQESSPEFSGDKVSVSLNGSMFDAVTQLEKAMLIHTLKETNGNQSKAAKKLDLSEKSVRDRLKKWGIANPGKK